ncbi:MAG TPA: aspartate aminotransferase family protein [Ilumatobacter sp.]|nr:aspartate aminotransferase family protein [Ilumatobacter sp.]
MQPTTQPTRFPEHGRAVDAVLADLAAKRSDDVRWRDGRTFGLVFNGGHDVHAVAEQAAVMYLHDNALNPFAFPSLMGIEQEVVDWTARLLHGPDTAAGFLTSGGTESIQCAVLAARERGRAERGIRNGEIVLAESAHAAFHKSAHMYDMPVRKVPVRREGDGAWTADVEAMAAAVTDQTVLVVGSAPQYPQGVVDDIPAIAALAATVGANCHVDACMGGFVLPFAEQLGREVPPWDFRVDGVHTISADIHKLGYAPKGVSVILHRTKESRFHQIFFFDDWLGGLYASPNLQGTRSGAPMAAAWAVMQHLGLEGYLRLTEVVLRNADKIRAAVDTIPGLKVLGQAASQPVFHLLAIATDHDVDPAQGDPIDVFALGDALKARGWHHDRQNPPDSLHLTVSNTNTGVIDEYLDDLYECAEQVRGQTATDRSANYSGTA